MFSNSEALSRASHELRTPLNAILGFGQLLALDELTDSQRHSVEQILAGAGHLLALIDDLRDLAREGVASIEPTDAGAAIRQAVALSARLAAGRSLTVKVETREEPVLILGDRRRLMQILLNLISNAVKYNRPGGTITVRAHADGDEEIWIEVIDTGRGMTQADLDRLFMPFERLSAARHGIEGSGLGLAVSQTLAEAMQATIDVVSTPSVGSVFTLRLPAAPAPAVPAPRRARALAAVA